MTRHRPLTPDELDSEGRALYDLITRGPRANGPQHFALKREDGSLTGPFDAFLLNPALGQALQELGSAIRYAGALTPRSRELAILTVATSCRSDFERRAHEAVGRAVGLTEQELHAIREGRVPDLADPQERLCAELALAMTQGDVDDRLWASASENVGTALIFEITTLVGYYQTLALQMKVFRVE